MKLHQILESGVKQLYRRRESHYSDPALFSSDQCRQINNITEYSHSIHAICDFS